MVTASELSRRPHSYRNFQPEEFIEAMEVSGADKTLAALEVVESSRFLPIAESTSDFFFKLDADEQGLFTQRNPGLVRWMSVWNRLEGFNSYELWFERATGLLTHKLQSNRVGQPEREFERVLPDDYEAPPYERERFGGPQELLASMSRRRRSYRNWAPPEFWEVAQRREWSVSGGQAREIGLFTPEAREDIDFPIDVDGKQIARALFQRIEDGRFEPIIAATQRFFRALDPDEKVLFLHRNPGILTWVAPWGFAEDVLGEDPERGLFPMSTVEWPPVETVVGGETNRREKSIGDIRSDIQERMG